MFRQYDLQHASDSEDHRLDGVWLEVDHRLKVGALVRLKGDERWWQIRRVGQHHLSHPPRTDWKIGGIL